MFLNSRPLIKLYKTETHDSVICYLFFEVFENVFLFEREDAVIYLIRFPQKFFHCHFSQKLNILVFLFDI